MSDASAPFPERLGRYEVLLPIASGGMATVYLARSTGIAGFEREVALKLTHGHLREDPDFVTSLIDEARLAGRIRHPNVVSVLDVGQDPHGVFIVMDYVEGDSLANVSRLLRKRELRLPIELALRILDDMLAGLHAAHELRDPDGELLDVVHRDVTPQNVLVGIDGVTRLTDFGIAKAATRMGRTSSGLIKGKIAYMSPEQAQGEALDRTCDVWAAGVIAWELLSGTRLHDGPHDAAVLLKVVREAPMRLRHVAPEIPAALDEVVAKALTLDAKERFQSADAFAGALTKAVREAKLVRAETRDVGDFLRPLLADKLDSRRRKVREVQALRRRVGELAAIRSRAHSSSSFGSESSETSDDSSERAPIIVPLGIDAEHEATTRAVEVASIDSPVESGAPATETAGVSDEVAAFAAKKTRDKRVIAAGASALALVVLGIGVALSGNGEAPAAERAASAPLAPEAPPPDPPAPLAAPAPEVTAPPAAPSSSVSEPVASAAPIKSARAPAPRAPVKRPAAGSTRGKPLSNPYAKKP